MRKVRHASVVRLLRPARRLVAASRNEVSDRHLSLILAFTAGAINAGGFLAVGHYTSHMTGVISMMADQVALGAWLLAGAGAASLVSFMAGAATSAILINWARLHHGGAQYSLPLLLEAGLLAVFGIVGAWLADGPWITAGAMLLLCFVMGLQNATITKVSGARIRTTHLTGIVTDMGIELGKLFYRNSAKRPVRVMADRAKLRLLTMLVGAFLMGGVLGALGFGSMGFAAALPLAALLAVMGSVPAAEAALLRKSRFPQAKP